MLLNHVKNTPRSFSMCVLKNDLQAYYVFEAIVSMTDLNHFALLYVELDSPLVGSIEPFSF
jgi:hypothetical protein